MASELARAPAGVTWREVAAGCAAAYRALPCHGASPLAEGDLDRPARLGEARAAVDPTLVAVRREGARLVAVGGALAGLVPGVVLEEATPVGAGARARRLRVVTSDPFAAVLEPATSADATTTPAEGAGPPPSLRVVERPAPDLRLPLAVVDADGRPLDVGALPADLAAALRAPEVAARCPVVAAPADAAWLLVRGDDGAFGLRPAVLAGGDDAPFRADAATLPASLAQVFRVENLRRLASAGVLPALDPALHVELTRVGEASSPSTGAGIALAPGDRVRITVRNETGRAWDVWLFGLDASYGVSCLFPAPGDAPRLAADDRGPIPLEATVTDDTLGEEHLLVIAVPPVAGALPAEPAMARGAPARAARGARRPRARGRRRARCAARGDGVRPGARRRTHGAARGDLRRGGGRARAAHVAHGVAHGARRRRSPGRRRRSRRRRPLRPRRPRRPRPPPRRPIFPTWPPPADARV